MKRFVEGVERTQSILLVGQIHKHFLASGIDGLRPQIC